MTTSSSQERDLGPILPWLLPAVLLAATALLLWQLTDVALVIFSSILIATAFCGLAAPIQKFLKAPHGAAVLIVVLLFVGLVAAPLTIYGKHLWAQFDEIALDIPAAIENLRQTIEAHPSGRALEGLIGGADFSRAAAPVAQHIGALAAAVGLVASNLIFMFFGGVYLALDPDRYVKGLIYFTPASYRTRVRHFIQRSGTNLRMWLFTQLLVVLMNGIFSTLGLWTFGVDSAVALGILAGVLSFIPYVGTIVAMAIGALAALTQGPQFAIYALIVLGAVSFFEGYFVTPYIQSRTLSIPPVTLLFSLFAFTVLFGTFGIILAAPLTIVAIVAIDTFYAPEQDKIEERQLVA